MTDNKVGMVLSLSLLYVGNMPIIHTITHTAIVEECLLPLCMCLFLVILPYCLQLSTKGH